MPSRALLLAPGLLVLQTGIVQLHSAQVDFFLKLDGITGESTDASHKGWIEVASFQWGVGHGVAESGRGTGAGAGRVQLHDLHITRSMDRASPALLRACASGQLIKEAQLDVVVTGVDAKMQTLTSFKFEEAQLVTVNEGGAAGTALPTESIELAAQKVLLPAVQTQGSTGTAGDGFSELTLSDAEDAGN